MDIWSMNNPFCLSDTFIFAYHDTFKCYVFVKVNYKDKIEEIGVDLENRMHGRKFENMNGKVKASRKHKSIFNSIGNEYWHKSVRYDNL